MLRWPSNQGVMGDDPPYLSVGTEVSAKYKGAFCEAKVRKVVRSVKCKVTYKMALGTATVTDDQIRGTLRVGSVVEAKHSERKEYVEATITKIQDCSQYTVVFDDGDITTLRRTALCLKSGRHFAESETLDQLPLTHPEHFGNPVVGGRRGGRRSRNAGSDESSDEEELPIKGKSKEEKEADIGKVVCVELGDKKKQKDNWFPGLVVAPTAQEVVRIRVKDEYLVRSFKDGRYFTVPKKEATEFTREVGLKVDHSTLKTAVDKALQYLDKDELPPHWDRELLFGLDEVSSNSDTDGAYDSDSSDDEPREEKDHFVAQLYKFMDDRGTPINRGPAITGRDVDLYKLFKVVHKLGGCNRVTNHNQWKVVSHKLGFGQFPNTANLVKVQYKKYLHSFEDFYRKLGCTMVNHPRGNRSRHKGGRSLIRDKDRATPVNEPQGDGKDKGSDNAEGEDDDQSDGGEEITENEGDEAKEERDDELDQDVAEDEEKDDRPQRTSREAKREERVPRKDDKVTTSLTVKEVDVIKSSSGPPLLERKPSDPQIKVVTPKGKPSKKNQDVSAGKNLAEVKRRMIVHKLKGARIIGDDEDDELDVEEFDEDDEDKLTTTRSKSKEENTRLKKDVSDIKVRSEYDKKSRVMDGSERKIKPSLTATAEKRTIRPSLTASAEKKIKAIPLDPDRKTVRSLAAEFDKKARGFESEKKDRAGVEIEKKTRLLSSSDGEKKIRPSLSATLERKRPSSNDGDRKTRPSSAGDGEKKIRPSLTADPERKKVRPSLTADPTKKSSRSELERKRSDIDRKTSRPVDTDKEDDRRGKIWDGERRMNLSDSSRISSADSDKKSSKSDSGDSDKRGSSKAKKGDDDRRKLQMRKRKESDDISAVDDGLDQLPSYKNVIVGDKLKVYYGPTHESKVTYEAKVLEVEGDGQDAAYLVHYTGWNNRYDEWIKRFRIADNLSWSPVRAKRRHQTQLAGAKKTLMKRRTQTPGRDTGSPQLKEQGISLPGDKRDNQPPRSTTPSSVTSSSSRTKSPATRPNSSRVTRNTTGETPNVSNEQITRRTRTRRISGQTDLVASESESEVYESESEVEPSVTRKSSRRLVTDKDEDVTKKEMHSRRRVKKRDTEVEVDEDDDKEEDKDEDLDASSESPSEDKVQSKRTRKGTRLLSERKVVEVKIEQEEDEEEATSSQPAKGRDFDLNQIRSELKGIDKTTKVSSDLTEEQEEINDSIEVVEEKFDIPAEVEEPANDMEDVYEFKEPEPFEFEVRTKRETSVERTGKLQKRPLPRIFDEIDKSDNNLSKKKFAKTKAADSETSDEGSPNKKRFRRTVIKKEDDEEFKNEVQSEAPELVPEKLASQDPGTPQKKTSTSEDAFEKLRQSPSYRLSGTPVPIRTTPSNSPVVPGPFQTPPQTASTSPVAVNSHAPALTPTRPPAPQVTNQAVVTGIKVLPPSKSVVSAKIPPVIPMKVSPTPGPPKQATMQNVKAPSVAKSIQSPPHLTSPTTPGIPPSRPPTLAAVVDITTDSVKVPSSSSSDWLESSTSNIKVEAGLENTPPSAKGDKDDNLPRLASTPQTILISDRTSPEPPQLLPMFGPSPKVITESLKTATTDVPMPEIKKESGTDSAPESPAVLKSVVTSTVLMLVSDENLEDSDSPRKVQRKKPQGKRKKAVSKEFVDDSESDSSDEGRRLIIDKSESSESSTESPDERLSATQKKSSVSKKPENVPEPSKAQPTQKDGDTTSSKLSADQSDSALHTELIVKEEPEEAEVDSNLCSLLCEETIPGSPAPPADTPADCNNESSTSSSVQRSLEGSKSHSKLLEMPFASVPGNARAPGPSTTTGAVTLHHSKTAGVLHGENSYSKMPDLGNMKAGSSASVVGSKRDANEAAPVMDNTPPTTPDSTLSTISNSPRGDRGESPVALDNESIKSHNSDTDNKEGHYSDDDIDVAQESERILSQSIKKEDEDCDNQGDPGSTLSPLPKKRRRSRKPSESEDRLKRPRNSAMRTPVRGAGAGSDSDDNTENLIPASQTQLTTMQTQAARSPRPSKYNFSVELAPELDASQRIALLTQKLQELRKTYANVKAQLACIDRRRKKLRRREREEKSSKQEVSCS